MTFMWKWAIASAVGGALFALPVVADTNSATDQCVKVQLPKREIEKNGGQWIELTMNQLQFLRGIYVLNPTTPQGLPYGDRAVLARFNAGSGGLIFFIDGEQACTPMLIPNELIDMLNTIRAGTVRHAAIAL
jgi:hypothetical protein